MAPALVRFLLAAGITATLFAAWRLTSWIVLRRSAAASRRLSQFARGTPGIVYFTTAECVTCRVAQKPALASLTRRMGPEVQVIELDALEHSDLAREWAVLSVPTTFVLDREGRPRQVNHGFASTEKLAAQLAAIA